METGWGRGGWTGGRLPSRMRQEHALGCGGSHRAPAESWQACPLAPERNVQILAKPGRVKEGGRRRRLSRTRPAPVTAGGAAGPKQGSDPSSGRLLGTAGSRRLLESAAAHPRQSSDRPTAPHTWAGTRVLCNARRLTRHRLRLKGQSQADNPCEPQAGTREP